MEKLIELLNEHETPRSGIVFKSYDDYDGTFYGVDIDGETEIAWSDSYICGKRFGWVKRLFDKDKIDWSKFHKYSFYKKDNKFIQYYDYESLLMALSISDTPIEDLLLYLK